ncbi:MAG: 50S ribosomal protein L25, partial [Thermoleophilia bacterium]
MAEERVRLTVLQRSKLGSRESRRLRRQGLIPGVLYGRGRKPHAISIRERDLRAALSGPHGLHAILDVVLDGQKTAHPSVVKEVQRDPLRGHVIHVDFQEVRLDQLIHAAVAIELVGDSPGVRAGGVLTQLVREVSVEALPQSVPDALVLDVSRLGVGEFARVSDLEVPEGVKVLDDPETILASVAAPRRPVEAEEVEEAAVSEAPAEALAEEEGQA